MLTPSHAKFLAYAVGVLGISAELIAFLVFGAHDVNDQEAAHIGSQTAPPAENVAPRVIVRTREISL